tara:strand:- start:36 stop:278 length:243 start_codon:yes stop_codon:yes gene_type:complete
MAKYPDVNGWTNRETWSAALSIGNDAYLYSTAKRIGNYKAFVEYQIHGIKNLTTFEGYRWDDPKINTAEMESMIAELKDH